jgi:hypothetical protein
MKDTMAIKKQSPVPMKEDGKKDKKQDRKGC